ncbi:MAG: hypothetical protein JNJ83_22020 [Verrucomicrobiaceae bacterium]|nr:hypothetical protein [Verrucomicrobiaceae bacterium]
MNLRYRFDTAVMAFACAATWMLQPGPAHAGSGVVSELGLPTGATAGNTAVTQSWTVVSNINANHVTAKGEQVPAVGEALVYSNASGKLVRRLRSPLPYPYANFSKVLAASGDLVVVSEGEYSVRAFNCATGNSLWRVDFPASTVTGLATDGVRVLVGFLDTLEVVGAVLDAKTGTAVGASSWLEAIDYAPGNSLAIEGGWYAIGSPRNSVGAFTGAGAVFVVNPAGASTKINNPDPANGNQFGGSLAISGNSLYVGCHARSRVYHYDMRTLTLLETITPPSPSYTAFGSSLSASGHLLLIEAAGSPWLFDRNTGNLHIIFTEAQAGGPVLFTGSSLCGQFAAGKAGSKVFRSVGVSGGRMDGSIAAVTKQAAGGLGGPLFSSLTDATIDSAGTALFAASVSGNGVTPANNSGLWTGGSGMSSLLLREGAVTSGSKAGTPFRPFFSPDGSTAYCFTRSSTGAVSIWKQSGGSLVPFVTAGGSIFMSGDSSVSTVSKINSASGMQNTAAVVNLILKPGANADLNSDSLIARPGLLALSEAREGRQSAIPSVLHAQLSPRLAATASRLAYSSFLAGRPTASNAAVFTKVISGSTEVAAEKGQAPVGTASQFPDAKFSSFVGEAVSAGVTVMRATYKTGSSTAHGIWSFNHSNSAKHSVAWARGQVPGLPSGVTWSRFLKTFATTDGSILFLAQVKGPGINAGNDVGFWRCALGSNAPALMVREGQVVPNCNGAVISVIQQVDVGSDGSWALLARLGRSPAAQNQVLLGGRVSVDLLHSVVMRKGNAIDGAVPASTLLGLALPTNNTDAAGMGTLGQARLAENGSILHRATFKHGTELAVSGIWGY